MPSSKKSTHRSGTNSLLSPLAGLSRPVVLTILVLASTVGVYFAYGALAASSPQQVADTIVSNARAYLGMAESPSGCNCGGTKVGGVNINTFTQNSPEAWCADFVSYIFWKSGHGFHSASAYEKTPAAQSVANWYKTYGIYYADTATNRKNHPPQHGDVMFYANPSAGSGVQHVGIMDTIRTDGELFSIDGNYANSVAWDGTPHWTTSSYIIGWGRLKSEN